MISHFPHRLQVLDNYQLYRREIQYILLEQGERVEM